ncbi:MAG: hypothetical protein H7325_00615 [Pedobacter sp.]|nr:hypothetical protein [Pedobacter sp.]
MSRNIIKKSVKGMPLMVFGQSAPKALVSVNTSKEMDKAMHKEGKANKIEEEGKKEWVLWGTNDSFPKDIVRLIRKSTVGKSGLHLLTKAIYGQKLMTYKVLDYDAQGREVIQFVKDDEWETIMRQSNFNVVRLALMQDYSYFGWNVPEIRFNGNKTKVWGIDYHKTSHCRMAPVDDKGKIKNLFISGNFPEVVVADCQNIPVIDYIRYPDQIEEIKNNLTDFKYVMPQLWPDPLNDYYPSVYWDSARESGWLEIATSIPAYKKALFKNQMSLKYDIQIPYEYLEALYPNFSKKTEEEQDKIIDTLYDDIVDKLTGADNAQKALMSFFRTDTKTGKPIGNWIIKVIDDKMSNDAYLPDSAAANSEILFAMNVNPARTGQGNTGGGYTGGANNGGSNIREADLAMRSQLQSDRDIVYSFFEFVKLYNGMDPDLKLGVQDQVMTTLDTGAGTKKTLS